ncbi:MAG TPA: hypothetical protein DEF01_05635 [Gemmatimonadetes bacterium]|nr:hypothetical protein [Gemmatimonadota bacterium]
MAADHTLAHSVAQAGSSSGKGPEAPPAVLRLYTWKRPTISFGRNEPVVGVYSPDSEHLRNIDLVRRPTGGRAVLHDAELTYAVAVPSRALGGARETYRVLNHALLNAVRSLGTMADIHGDPNESALPLSAGPCFQSPAEGEVTVNGRKLIGSAQARIGGALLQHGSIMISGDQTLLSTIGLSTNHHQPATLSEQIGAVDVERVANAVISSMKRFFGGSWLEGEYSADEKRMLIELVECQYSTDQWTWRR